MTTRRVVYIALIVSVLLIAGSYWYSNKKVETDITDTNQQPPSQKDSVDIFDVGESSKVAEDSDKTNTDTQRNPGETLGEFFERQSKEITHPFPFAAYDVIQEVMLPSGKVVKLITADEVSEQSTLLANSKNCSFPEIEQHTVGLEYDDYTIAVGEIGVPKTRDGAWQRIPNPIDVGSENEMLEHEWSPLRVSKTNEVVVIDYTGIEPVDPPTLEELATLTGYVFERIKHRADSCEFDFTQAYLFRLYDSGYLGVDAYDPVWERHHFNFLKTFRLMDLTDKEGKWKDNCSPGGCG